MVRKAPDVAVVRIARAEFLARYWQYEPGEHVTLLGRTGSGKTTLAMQLLQVTATPKTPALILVMKPRDKTVLRWGKTLDYPRATAWPPMPSVWHPRKPSGWILWPRLRRTLDGSDDELLRTQFRRGLSDSYRRGDRILFADEVVGLTQELGMERELNTVWMRGRSMGCGLWASSQRPAHVPLHAYSQAEHLFLHHDADKRTRDRYREIGGVDPDLVDNTVMTLPLHHWLYIRRTGPVMCVVLP